MIYNLRKALRQTEWVSVGLELMLMIMSFELNFKYEIYSNFTVEYRATTFRIISARAWTTCQTETAQFADKKTSSERWLCRGTFAKSISAKTFEREMSDGESGSGKTSKSWQKA
jgi:hypothetical protein